MARSPSKIMTLAEKKVATAGLQTALKNHQLGVKALGTQRAEADRILAAAKKDADKIVANVAKANAVTAKTAQKALKAAQKIYDANITKIARAEAAAAKGTAKLTDQLGALQATDTAPAVKVMKAPKGLNGASPNARSLTAQSAA